MTLDVGAEEPRSLDLAMKERSLFRDLTNSPGWKALMEIAEGQRIVRSNKIILTPCSMDRVSEQEFEKGEVAGILLFINMPETAIEGLSEEIDEWKVKLNIDEEKEDATRTAP